MVGNLNRITSKKHRRKAGGKVLDYKKLRFISIRTGLTLSFTIIFPEATKQSSVGLSFETARNFDGPFRRMSFLSTQLNIFEFLQLD